MLSSLALLVALSGAPDYAAIAQRSAPPPTSTAPPATAPVVVPGVASDVVVAEVQPLPVDPRFDPALDWYDWDRLADCESGGRWDAQGARYGGGLQILGSTWRAYGGTEFAELPGLASREEQIVVGRAIVEDGGWRQWPWCARRLGLS